MGRVVRPGEPLWTQEDSSLAVALTIAEATTCSGCGQDRRESTEKENEFAYEIEAIRCHACATRDRFVGNLPENFSRAGAAFIPRLKEQASG